MKDLSFEVKNNTIAVRLTKEQMNFCIVVKDNRNEIVTGEYVPIICRPEASTEIKILDLPWKSAPKVGEEYKILGRPQDSKSQQWGDWSVQRWTAPGKATLMPRIKNPSAPVTTQPPAPVRAPAAMPATSPAVNPPVPSHQSIVRDISERLGKIETDLGEILENFRIKAVPPQKYLLKVEKTLEDVLETMKEIIEQIREGRKTSPLDYKQVSEKFEACREKADKASKLLKGAQDALLARSTQVPRAPAATAARHPAPIVPAVPTATTPVVDLDPINDRIGTLEQQLRDVTDQLAEKASANVATAPAPATVAPVVATAPVVPVVPATPTNVAATTPVVAPTTTNGKKGKKSRESVNFFALVLGIVLGVLALIIAVGFLTLSGTGVFFYATRSQDISAERIGASDAKSAAAAEIENARRLQMEMVDRMHDLQQQVEGYRRQTFVTPPMPKSPVTLQIVTNKIVTTNVVVMTNTVITHTTSQDESGPRRPAIEMGP